MNITALIMRDFAGLIDIDLSIENIRQALTDKANKDMESDIQISTVLSDVFDSVPSGKRIPLPDLTAMVATKLNWNPYKYQQTVEQIHSFIRSSPNVYSISPGRSGGVSRL